MQLASTVIYDSETDKISISGNMPTDVLLSLAQKLYISETCYKMINDMNKPNETEITSPISKEVVKDKKYK